MGLSAKFKTLAISSAIVSAGVLASVSGVFAHGGWAGRVNPTEHQHMLSEQAKWLDISEADLKSELKTKSFLQIAADHGKTLAEVNDHRQTLGDQRRQAHEAELRQALAAKGFSDEQVDSILGVLKEHHPAHHH